MAESEVDEVYCRECKTATDHTVVYAGSRSSPRSSPESWCVESKAVKCGGCKTLSVLERRSSDHELAYGHDDPCDDGWRLVPEVPQNRHVEASDVGACLPRDLAHVYVETISAINANLRLLGAAGIRSLIEGTCSNQDIKGGYVLKDGEKEWKETLQGQIEGLAQNGKITTENAKHLHELRLAGNDVLHRLDVPPVEELRLAMVIVEHLLAQVFMIEGQAKILEDMRRIRKEDAPPRPPRSVAGTV